MIDTKVLEDITNNFKNNLFSDLKILTGFLNEEDLKNFIDDCLTKLYK